MTYHFKMKNYKAIFKIDAVNKETLEVLTAPCEIDFRTRLDPTEGNYLSLKSLLFMQVQPNIPHPIFNIDILSVEQMSAHQPSGTEMESGNSFRGSGKRCCNCNVMLGSMGAFVSIDEITDQVSINHTHIFKKKS